MSEQPRTMFSHYVMVASLQSGVLFLVPERTAGQLAKQG
jgi:hypothetical protein